MTDARLKRQKAIAAMIKDHAIASQEEVTSRLAELGFAATQATVSRDLDQLGAVKVKQNGALRYALPDEVGHSDWAAARLDRVFSEWVRAIEGAGNLLVVRTPPGSAHLVALAIDQAKLAEVAGTIAGDDTLFVALRDGVSVDSVASRFRAMSSQ